MEKDVTLSTRVPSALAAQVDMISQQYNRSRSWLVQDALKAYVENELQFIAAVEEGRAAHRRGEVVPHKDVVKAWQRRKRKRRS